MRDAHAAGDGARPVGENAEFVLYWMTASRRVEWNFALQRAVEWANLLELPLVVFEPLRVDYPWACDRFHAFVAEGMVDNQRACTDAGVAYYPYLEPERGAGEGLLQTLAELSAAVVTDDYPCFFLPAQLRAARRVVQRPFEAVDSNGLYPMRATDRVFARAFDLRRHLQKELPPHLSELPMANPLSDLKVQAKGGLLDRVQERWPAAPLDNPRSHVAGLPIDHSVAPVAERGGMVAAREQLGHFMEERFADYGERRNQPDEGAASELSFWLHWGHLSAHEVFDAVVRREEWTPNRLGKKTGGARTGWWGMSPTAESFLDELITWRELGFNMTCHRRDYDRYESLPEWARDTLQEHASDTRPQVYTLEQFERAETHDELWNAAQRQLARDGRVHNYLRMLWGKKVLHWSESPREALRIMIHLNNKYAVDGRDPNSYSGIFWVLGRYDRAWGPEREVFGKIRYMSSDNTARKVRLKEYVRRYAPQAEKPLF